MCRCANDNGIDNYVPGFITSVRRLLRRTLVRIVLYSAKRMIIKPYYPFVLCQPAKLAMKLIRLKIHGSRLTIHVSSLYLQTKIIVCENILFGYCLFVYMYK